jgi:hypothetical protein
MIMRRQRQHADHAADPMVRCGVPEEGAVAAIVLDHEQAKEKTHRGKEKKSVKPIEVKLHGNQHPEPREPEGENRDNEFEKAPPVIRSLIGSTRGANPPRRTS